MELSYFVEETLYPAIWERLNDVFPEMGFIRSGARWISGKNLDGTEPKGKRRDKTVVTQRYFQVATENGEGGSKNLISLYMEHNGLARGERVEAIKKISDILGLSLPDGGKFAEEYEKKQKTREQLALSYDRQKKALFSKEGAEVLRYLKEERGYNEELIKEMGLGYLSPDEAKHLEENTEVGLPYDIKSYPLSIPFFSGGKILGFKLRSIKADIKPKYKNTRSLNNIMNSNPFALTPNQLGKGKEVIVAEGELDALHAISLGLTNTISVAGGDINEGIANSIQKNGYKDVIIILDTDEAGQTYTRQSIERVDNMGLNSYIVTLPDAKDIDEYLQKHTVEDLESLIKSEACQFGGRWLYTQALEKYKASEQTDKDFMHFLEDFTEIAKRCRDSVKRGWLTTYLRADFAELIEKEIPGLDLSNLWQGLRDKIEQQTSQREEETRIESALHAMEEAAASIKEKNGKEASTEINALQGALATIETDIDKREALNTIKEATSFLSKGKFTDEALKEAKKQKRALKEALNTLQVAEINTSAIIEDNTEELWRQYRESQVGLRSKFILKHREGKELVDYDFYFPSGAISVIGAQTNHGKSKVLQSVALDALEELTPGETLLYVTYEENELNVNKQFLNAYANLLLTNGNNAKTITEYLCNGDTQYIKKEALPKFKEKELEWKNIRRDRKIKIIKPEDNYLETLLGIIDFATKHLKIKAIFIDYAQEIYVRDWSKYSRTDELKQAMVMLDATAQRTHIPIILAAQLNREANSPLALYNQYIADSGWIERKASEIILIWSSHEDIEAKDADKVRKAIKEKIEEDLSEAFTLNTDGKLYFKLTKSRNFPKGSHAIVPINGNTGRVGNIEPEPTEQPGGGGGMASPLARTKKRVEDTVTLFQNEQLEELKNEDDLPF